MCPKDVPALFEKLVQSMPKYVPKWSKRRVENLVIASCYLDLLHAMNKKAWLEPMVASKSEFLL